MSISFDIISDLNLNPEDSFNWENKPTSLYCLIAGNVSSDLRTTSHLLGHLSKLYQGVFYIPGYLEYKNSNDFEKTTNDLAKITRKYKNVALLHNHVVIIDGVAILGCNGWHHNEEITDTERLEDIANYQYDDIVYIKNSIEKLQKHLDIKKIVMISNAVPLHYLFYGEIPKHLSNTPELSLSLVADSEVKVSNWVFGTYGKIVDTKIDNINYLNNGYFNKRPYWPKRFTVEF